MLGTLAAAGKLVATWALLRRVFRWQPVYCVGILLFNLSKNAVLAPGLRQSPSAVAAPELLALGVEAVAFTALTLALEAWRPACDAAARLLRRAGWPGPAAAAAAAFASAPAAWRRGEDAAVAAERARVESGGSDGDVLTTVRLAKTYPGADAPALASLSLGVAPGECLGLLGVNGAGKARAGVAGCRTHARGSDFNLARA